MKFKVVYSNLLILLASCTSELPYTPDPIDQEQEVPVQFTYSVQTEREAGSRAINESDYLEEGSRVGFYALKGEMVGEEFILADSRTWADANLHQKIKNSCYEAQTVEDYTGEKIHRLKAVGASGGFEKKENAALRFYGYYPYTTDVSFTEGLAVPHAPKIPIQINNNIEETTDYLYTGPIDAQKTEKETNILFKHALSRLNIYIVTDNFSQRSSPKLNKVEVCTNEAQKGYLDIETGKYTADDSYDYDIYPELYDFPIELASPPRIMKNNNEVIKASILLCPNTSLFCINFHITGTDKVDRVFQVEASELENLELKGGFVTKLYISYNLTY